MKKNLKNMSLEDKLSKEWLITNGIGGFASSTIIGANTRRYHGLLIAPLTPPARRHLIISKLDESIQIGNKKYDLYTNMSENYISEGYKYLEKFEKEYYPKFVYKVDNVKIEKSICMVYGKNIVSIEYKVKTNSEDAKLILAPIVNFRDFHGMSTHEKITSKQIISGNKVRLEINNKSNFPVYMNISEGKYIKHENDIFYNMFYIEENKRGFYPMENHLVPGRYEVNIPKNSEKIIHIVLATQENIEELDSDEIRENEINRLNKIIDKTEILQEKDDKLLKQYIISTDNFIAYRQSFGLHTIIAGFPWFLDWGRDSLISFEGLLLITKRFDIAREVLLTFIKDVKFGLVPNGYSGYDDRPLYNSADASLLLFEQVQKYLEYTNDYDFIFTNIYNTLKRIISSYTVGIDLDNNNIYLDKDGLIVSGTENTQNTWMDVKIGNFAVTPRNGKVVEMNSLWYNALKIMEDLSARVYELELSNKYEEMAKKCKRSFEKKFYNKDKKCLYDVLGDSKIRPNQLFSMSLTYPIINPSSKIGKEVFETVTKKLLKKHGLKTLAKGEENYIEIYEGDSFKRDMSYHQGITWPWLLGLYNNTLKNMIKSEKTAKNKKELEAKYKKFKEDTNKTFKKALLEEGCIGGIAELYDSKPPYLPKGAINQAWSVAEILRIIK